MHNLINERKFYSTDSSSFFDPWFHVASLVICAMFCIVCGFSLMERKFNQFREFISKCFCCNDFNEKETDSTTALISKKEKNAYEESDDDVNYHKDYYYQARKNNNINLSNGKQRNIKTKDKLPGKSVPQSRAISSVPINENKCDLCFVVIYNITKKSLLINLLEALYLNAAYNCYVTISLTPGSFETKISKTQENSNNPKFIETFVFDSIEEENLKVLTLNLKLCDQLDSDNHQILGETKYELNLILLNELQNDERSTFVQSRLTPATVSEKFLGNIQLSLCLDIKKMKIVVQIIQCKNLKTSDSVNSTNPFCSLELKTTSSIISNKTTSTKNNTNNPVWREKISFSINENLLKNVYLIIKINNKNKSGEEAIGTVTFPSTVGTTEFSHWSQMKTKQGEPITEWHDIKCS